MYSTIGTQLEEEEEELEEEEGLSGCNGKKDKGSVTCQHC